MTYEEYVLRRKAGTITAGVDRSVANQLTDYLPKSQLHAHMCWTFIWMLSVPAFICVSIFIKWWIGLLLLFFITPAIGRAVRKMASTFVLEHAEANKDFFDMLVENNLLIFKELP